MITRLDPLSLGLLLALLAAPAVGQWMPPKQVANVNSTARAEAVVGKLPIAFIENAGQWDTPARYVARRGSMTARLEPDAIVLQVEAKSSEDAVTGAVVRLAFESRADDVRLEGERRQPGRYNFFLSNDRTQWRRRVAAFSSVRYRGVWDGIDVRVREGAGRILEYDLLVAADADLGRAVFRCDGAKSLRLVEDELVIETTAGPIRMKAPVSWEESPTGKRRPIVCRYRLLDAHRFAFVAEVRRADHALVVDPGLVFSTYLGGSAFDVAGPVAVGPDGDVFVAGGTESPNFPTTPGAYQRNLGPRGSGFLTRLSADGRRLVYSTFFRGFTGRAALAIEPGGEAILVAQAGAGLPVTAGAYDTTYNGNFDHGVLRFSSGGDRLLYGTYLGGASYESYGGVGLAIDASGAAVIVGGTHSTDFPTTPGAYDRQSSATPADPDAYVARLLPRGNGAADLLYSTFLGGTNVEQAGDIHVDVGGRITVVGFTSSADFPVTGSAYDKSHGGSFDAFISRIDPALAGAQQLVYSTFVGGSGDDRASACGVDAAGVVTATGITNSTDFPATAAAFQTGFQGGRDDGFVLRLDPSSSPPATQLVYATYLGGSGSDRADEVLVDVVGRATIVGSTDSADFPVSPRAFDPTHNGKWDHFVARLSASGAKLEYSTFIGGRGEDFANAAALASSEAVVLAGSTSSTDFPTTPGSYSPTYNGGTTDAFVTELAITALSGSGTPRPGGAVTLALDAPGDAGLRYQLGSSLATGPIPIGNRTLALSPDALFIISISDLWPTIFAGYRGTIGTNGTATAKVVIPNQPVLVGYTIHTAFVTLQATAPEGVRSVSNTYSFKIAP